MKRFYQYGKKHFEFELRRLLFKNKIGSMEEITEEFLKESYTEECIYKIKTKNPSVSIIVFSSVDVKTNFTRDLGADAVRIVMEWKTKNGFVYKKIGKHLRIDTLFNNVEKSLLKAKAEIFNLNYKEFQKKTS